VPDGTATHDRRVKTRTCRKNFRAPLVRLKVIYPSEISIEQSSHDLGKKGERKKKPEFVQIRVFSFSRKSFLSRSPKVFRTRDVSITLDHTRTPPFLLVVTRLFIKAGGSVAHSTKTCHLREPHIVVGSAQGQLGFRDRTNERISVRSPRRRHT